MQICGLTNPLGQEVTLLFPLINAGFEENQGLVKEKFRDK